MKTKIANPRRRLLGAITLGGASATALPTEWARPVVKSVLMTVHAVTTIDPISITCETSFTEINAGALTQANFYRFELSRPLNEDERVIEIEFCGDEPFGKMFDADDITDRLPSEDSTSSDGVPLDFDPGEIAAGGCADPDRLGVTVAVIRSTDDPAVPNVVPFSSADLDALTILATDTCTWDVNWS